MEDAREEWAKFEAKKLEDPESVGGKRRPEVLSGDDLLEDEWSRNLGRWWGIG